MQEFEKAKLNLLMIKSVPENEPEEVDSDDVSEERTIQLWKQPPIKPMEEWLADSRARLQEEWATNFAPNATQSARDAAKQGILLPSCWIYLSTRPDALCCSRESCAKGFRASCSCCKSKERCANCALMSSAL